MEDKINTMVNLTGLVDISFSYFSKESKELMQIFDSNQIHYTTEQSKKMVNPLIPILIMNHLPLDRKLPPKFDNYCAFLYRDALVKNLQDKKAT